MTSGLVMLQNEFQSTPPHGGRRRVEAVCSSVQVIRSFNPRPRTGGDVESRTSESRYKFQSTPPHGGRRIPRSGCGGQESFNPRPRTGGDPGTVSSTR